MKILVTGVAGFIGYHLSERLLELDHEVLGIDNLNEYYDVSLKEARLQNLLKNRNADNFIFKKSDIADIKELKKIFNNFCPEVVVNLAAQAGVRYSIEQPQTYIDSNCTGFLNILECSKDSTVNHLVYASSSSVYGLNKKQPFSIDDNVDFPVSLYAASKKSNELMAHTYSHLYGLPTTGLRFFTVYGPYGRPDMALFKFTKAILENKPIEVYNNGNLKRDFTYIDDIIDGVVASISKVPSKANNTYTNSNACSAIFNLGNKRPVLLEDFISEIEKVCGKKAIKNYLPMQKGDVEITFADIEHSFVGLGFDPTYTISAGIKKFVDWYKEFYGKK